MIKPFYLDLTDREIENIKDTFGTILRSGVLILGKYTQEFETKFSSYIGSRYAVSLNSATSALEVLLTLKEARGVKIAVPSNTNFATVAAIIRAGGMPVFMDMTKEYFIPNLDIIKYTVRKYKVRGVVWVHIGGIISPDFPEVVEYCRSRNIFLIEDAAHSHGSQLKGIKAGNFADGGAFSFFPTKVMTTMEGGMITTNSEKDAKLIRSFRNQGKREGDYGGLHYDLGNSWRMTELAAYMGIVQLNKLDDMIGVRSTAVRRIAKNLRKERISYCDTSHMYKASQYKFIVRLNSNQKPDQVKRKLKEKGVICGGGVYDVPCHLQPVFKNIPYDKDELNTTEKYCARHICPPITSGTTEHDAALIGEALIQVLS